LNGHYELIDGEIISKMGKNPPHRLTLMAIAYWLGSLFGELCVQRQDPIRIPGEAGIYTEPEPDIAVTQKPTMSYKEQHPGPDDIVVIVEVADSSLILDMNIKALLYASAGVLEYWVADVSRRCVHIHRQPTGEGYLFKLQVNVGDVVALESRPNDTISVESLFELSE